MMNGLPAPTAFMMAMVRSCSVRKAVSELWMPMPARSRVKMPMRFRKKRKLSKKRFTPDSAVR